MIILSTHTSVGKDKKTFIHEAFLRCIKIDKYTQFAYIYVACATLMLLFFVFNKIRTRYIDVCPALHLDNLLLEKYF